MALKPHLLVDITSHGYGHVSQTSDVVNALALLVPGLRVTVRTVAPHQFLKQRFDCEFEHIPAAFDFGMKMASAVDVLAGESAAAYREFHADWRHRVDHASQIMRRLKPDLLLANVPYLSLAAARLAQVRAVAMCSLNWADIYQHYCVEDAASKVIHAQMLEAYNSADSFLKVQPAMDMPDLANARSIQPIARIGQSRRQHIAAKYALRDGEKLVMIAMGGMEFRLPMQSWPHVPGIRWIVPQRWQVQRADTIAFEPMNLSYTDVMTSCDALITKPGYGTFTEAACAGVPVLYVTRRDWPEEPCLVQWLQRHAVCLEVERDALQAGAVEGLLQRVWMLQPPARPEAGGAAEAAQYLAATFL